MNNGFGHSISKNLTAGGTITGDVTISGDLTVSGSSTYTYDEQVDGQVWIKDSTASSATQGGHLRLFSDDGAVMASGHRLGVLEFGGAEDTSSTITVGARIEALTDATWSDTENGADMVFYTTDGNASQAEVMRLTADNLVGIGQSAPSTMLDITASASGQADIQLDCLANTSGINQIRSDTDRASDGGDMLRIQVYNNSGTEAGSINFQRGDADTASDIHFRTSNSERMRIDQAGLVTVGTYNTLDFTPSLSVNGTQPALGLWQSDDDFLTMVLDATNHRADTVFDHAAVYRIRSATDPGTSGAVTHMILDVNSRISLSNNDSSGGATNTIFGYQAGNAIASGGNNNTLFGHQAGLLISVGDNNTVIGFKCLDVADDDETANIAIGSSAMGSAKQDGLVSSVGREVKENIAIGNTALAGGTLGGTDDLIGNIAIGHIAMASTGTNEHTGTIAIGHSALTALTSGAQNTAVGHTALDVEDTGSYSTAVGYEALTAQTGGASATKGNTAVGTMAGKGITGGQYNTAVGWLAADTNDTTGGTYIGQATGSNGTGDYCTFVGMGAGETGDNTQDGTIGIGFESLKALTSGAGNIAIGFEAGKTIAGGSSNTIVGHQAADDIGSADNNTTIGFQAMTAANSGDADDNTCVGYQAGDVILAGSDNTCIGSSTDPSAHGGVNQTVIGYATTGQADNSVTLGNASVTAVYMAQDSGAKVYAGGLGIGTTTVPHGGVGVGLVSIEGANADLPTGPNMSFTTATDDFPLMVLQNYQHDDVSIVFDAYHDGSAWKSSDASNFMIQKITNAFTMQYDSGITAGSALTWNVGFSMATNGNITGTHGDYHVSSDERLKKDIVTIPNALDKVLALRGVNFKWKAGDDESLMMGMIAQEVEAIIPEVVHTQDTEEAIKSVEYPFLVGVLVEAVKELSAKVEALEAK